jgi:hypothetical protein
LYTNIFHWISNIAAKNPNTIKEEKLTHTSINRLHFITYLAYAINDTMLSLIQRFLVRLFYFGFALLSSIGSTMPPS